KGRSLSRSPGRIKVTVSVSSFVPKSHTPFQWEPQDNMDELKRKQAFLKQRMRGRGLVFNYHDPEGSFLEAVFSRGDRRLAAVLEAAWRAGSRFDGWSEFFDFGRWMKAFEATGIDPVGYAHRRFEYGEIMPWDHIGAGMSKKYLEREHRRALDGEITPDCRAGNCPGCGLCPTLEVKPRLAGGETIAPLHDSLQ
ncbi:MAG: B12-binding domain-containing radical SAM protein, partial [Desulfotomaculaceae bacterium]